MLRNNWISVLFTVLILASCQDRSGQSYEIASGADAKDFVEKEKAKNTYETKIKEVNFKLKYISNQEMALRELGDISKATQASFDSIVKGYDSLLFFNLEINIDHFSEEMVHYGLTSNDPALFEKRIAYYSFEMQKDISIVIAEKDTIPCTMYHYERNYGISPNNNFMLGFRASHIKNAVLVYDNAFLPTGPVKFALNEQVLLTHPQIKIN